jgi:hypothetical protein
MKEQLIKKYTAILSQSDFDEEITHLKVSLETIALMCANMELQLINSMPFKPTTLITQHIIQNIFEVLGAKRW